MEKEQKGSEASDIFRVVDDTDNLSLSGAKILLLARGNIFNQTTDSNGISKFILPFPDSGQLDAQISVSTKDYEINDQSVTLTPDKVQDIRLNPRVSKLTVSDVTPASNIQQAGALQSNRSATDDSAGSQPSDIAGPINAATAINKNGVVAKITTSNLVDQETGFRVSVESSATAKDKAEVRVVIASPDNQPFVGTYCTRRSCRRTPNR